MKALLDKLGGAAVTIIVTALIGLVTIMIGNHEKNSAHDIEIELIKYQLSELKKNFEKHEGHK